MTAKFKFCVPVKKEKFLFNFAFAKKSHPYFRQFLHATETNSDGSSAFLLRGSDGKEVLRLRFDFYPDNIVTAECEAGNFAELEDLLVFGFLEMLGEKAFVRFIDTKFFYSGAEFFVVQDGPNPKVNKLSSDKNTLLEVSGYRIPREISAENGSLDFV